MLDQNSSLFFLSDSWYTVIQKDSVVCCKTCCYYPVVLWWFYRCCDYLCCVCVCRYMYLAVSAGRKQQQITEQVLVNHFIFETFNHQLPHLFKKIQTQQQALSEGDTDFIMCASALSAKLALNEWVFRPTSCWSKTRSMSRDLMCCFFPWSCVRENIRLKSL